MLHRIERNLHPSSAFPEHDFSSNYAWPRAKNSGINSNEKTGSSSHFSTAYISSAINKKFAIKNGSFQNLEADLLLLIFKNISEKELSNSVCGVCRHWYKVGRDSRLWKKLEFKGKTEIVTTCNLLRKCPKLEYLSLNNVKNLPTVVRQMCRSNRSVKRVKINNCRDGDSENVAENVLRNILHSCRDLESFDLKGTQFSSTRFFHELANLPMLRDLNLSDNKHLCAKNLLSVALNCRNLEGISITNGNRGSSNRLEIGDEDVVFFFNTLSNSLKRVEFDTTGLGARSFQAILSCPNLEDLSLDHALLLTGDIFRSKFSNLRNLKRLRLTHACQLLSEDLIFLDKKRTFDNLTHIDLTGCSRISDVGLEPVLLSCKRKLTYLSLKSCKSIGDLNIVVDNCPKLRYLNIAHTFVHSRHVPCIDNLPTKIPKLRKLVVDTKMISDYRDLIAKLRSRAPQLTMVKSRSEFHKDEATVHSTNKYTKRYC